VETVEPGGTGIGQQIRKILLNPDNFDLKPRAELLLYFASRAQNVDQVIRPALDAGRTVLCDRFTDSTLVYQGCGRGLDTQVVRELDRIACRGLKPDVTFLVDIELETSLARARRRNERTGPSESRIDEESAAFHERVRQGYLALAKTEPERIVVIDGRVGIGEVAHRIREALGLLTGDRRV
jgi:dTMP kinase